MKAAAVSIILIVLLLPLSGCKPKIPEVPPLPDFKSIEKNLSDNLDPVPRPETPPALLQERIFNVGEQLSQCDANSKSGNCDKIQASNYYLLLGDLHFDSGLFEKAVVFYQNTVLSRYEAFEKEKGIFDHYMKVNADEKAKRGDLPNLQAGAAFLACHFNLKAFKDYAEIVRAERRMGESYKKNDKNEDAATAYARAQLGLEKTMKHRMAFEKNKRILIGLARQLGKDYNSYDAHIQSWESEIAVDRI